MFLDNLHRRNFCLLKTFLCCKKTLLCIKATSLWAVHVFDKNMCPYGKLRAKLPNVTMYGSLFCERSQQRQLRLYNLRQNCLLCDERCWNKLTLINFESFDKVENEFNIFKLKTIVMHYFKHEECYLLGFLPFCSTSAFLRLSGLKYLESISWYRGSSFEEMSTS